jgi:ribosomal protein S18 acetylase RimI-like enzyme
MAGWRERSDAPWYGVDEALLRTLEAHETRVHALGPGRELVDLGDALALFDPRDPDPFFNRVAAVRWPDDPEAFMARVDEVVRLFEARQRQPHVWVAPGFRRPPDIAERLEARGFVDLGGGLIMLLVRDPGDRPSHPLPPGCAIARIGPGGAQGRARDARDAASVVAEVFGVSADRVPALRAEILAGLDDPLIDVRLVRADGEPVAVGRRHGFDAISYLSAIGVRRGWQGRGLGEAVTRALIDGADAAGHELVYLGVYPHNERARELYERLGFAILGGPAPDLILP